MGKKGCFLICLIGNICDLKWFHGPPSSPDRRLAHGSAVEEGRRERDVLHGKDIRLGFGDTGLGLVSTSDGFTWQ